MHRRRQQCHSVAQDRGRWYWLQDNLDRRLLLDGSFDIELCDFADRRRDGCLLPRMDFPAFCGREKLTALPARRNADAYESEYREDPSDLRIYQSQPK